MVKYGLLILTLMESNQRDDEGHRREVYIRCDKFSHLKERLGLLEGLGRHELRCLNNVLASEDRLSVVWLDSLTRLRDRCRRDNR